MELSEKKLTPGQEILEGYYLVPGIKIKLIKQSSDKHSEVAVGSTLEGILDFDVRIGEPIYLDNKNKNTSPITGIKKDGNRLFLKTDTSIYELVPPTDSIKNNTDNKSPNLIGMEKNIERELRRAQANAINGKDLLLLTEKRFNLSKIERTPEIINQISLVSKEISKYMVTVDTLLEFKTLVEKLDRNYYFTIGTISHENAHANMTEALCGKHRGYSIVVFKKEDGTYGYQPISHFDFSSVLDPEEKIKKEIRVTNAPEEYGNKLSPGDKNRIQELEKQLKNL
ncbi:MAG: hypothetical protein WCI91_03705 [Candidatus Nomurabacteria bacterium]